MIVFSTQYNSNQLSSTRSQPTKRNFSWLLWLLWVSQVKGTRQPPFTVVAADAVNKERRAMIAMSDPSFSDKDKTLPQTKMKTSTSSVSRKVLKGVGGPQGKEKGRPTALPSVEPTTTPVYTSSLTPPTEPPLRPLIPPVVISDKGVSGKEKSNPSSTPSLQPSRNSSRAPSFRPSQRRSKNLPTAKPSFQPSLLLMVSSSNAPSSKPSPSSYSQVSNQDLIAFPDVIILLSSLDNTKLPDMVDQLQHFFENSIAATKWQLLPPMKLQYEILPNTRRRIATPRLLQDNVHIKVTGQATFRTEAAPTQEEFASWVKSELLTWNYPSVLAVSSALSASLGGSELSQSEKNSHPNSLLTFSAICSAGVLSVSVLLLLYFNRHRQKREFDSSNRDDSIEVFDEIEEHGKSAYVGDVHTLGIASTPTSYAASSSEDAWDHEYDHDSNVEANRRALDESDDLSYIADPSNNADDDKNEASMPRLLAERESDIDEEATTGSGATTGSKVTAASRTSTASRATTATSLSFKHSEIDVRSLSGPGSQWPNCIEDEQEEEEDFYFHAYLAASTLSSLEQDIAKRRQVNRMIIAASSSEDDSVEMRSLPSVSSPSNSVVHCSSFSEDDDDNSLLSRLHETKAVAQKWLTEKHSLNRVFASNGNSSATLLGPSDSSNKDENDDDDASDFLDFSALAPSLHVELTDDGRVIEVERPPLSDTATCQIEDSQSTKNVLSGNLLKKDKGMTRLVSPESDDEPKTPPTHTAMCKLDLLEDETLTINSLSAKNLNTAFAEVAAQNFVVTPLPASLTTPKTTQQSRTLTFLKPWSMRKGQPFSSQKKNKIRNYGKVPFGDYSGDDADVDVLAQTAQKVWI